MPPILGRPRLSLFNPATQQPSRTTTAECCSSPVPLSTSVMSHQTASDISLHSSCSLGDVPSFHVESGGGDFARDGTEDEIAVFSPASAQLHYAPSSTVLESRRPPRRQPDIQEKAGISAQVISSRGQRLPRDRAVNLRWNAVQAMSSPYMVLVNRLALNFECSAGPLGPLGTSSSATCSLFSTVATMMPVLAVSTFAVFIFGRCALARK